MSWWIIRWRTESVRLSRDHFAEMAREAIARGDDEQAARWTETAVYYARELARRGER